jgi:hypothetical protein
MNDRESTRRISAAPESPGLFQRLERLWTSASAEERYLAAATDPADLERRARVLERTSGGPVFSTFNH